MKKDAVWSALLRVMDCSLPVFLPLSLFVFDYLQLGFLPSIIWLVIRGTTEHGTAERRNEKQRNGIFFCFFFFFFLTKKKNNKEKVNISHKIKGMHIFFILRSRSRARLSSSFRVGISRRSVTALRTCSPQSRQ